MRTIKIAVLFLLTFAYSGLKSQTVEISVQVLQAFSSEAKLYLYKGTDFHLVDSSWQIAPGTYNFKLNEGYQQGMYKLNVGKNISFNIIVANEPRIDITTVVYAPDDSLKSANSLENNIFWQYQKFKKQNQQQTWLIQSLMEYYNKSHSFYQLLNEEFINLNNNLLEQENSIIKKHPDLLASKIIALEQKQITQNVEIKDIADLWWGNIDLNDIRILHSPTLQTRLWNYVEQFFSDQYDKEEQDDAFIEGISSLMEMKMSSDIKRFFRNTLISGFIDSDYQPVIEYIETTRFGELEALRKKTPIDKKSVKVNVGDKAFDFVVKLPNGKNTKLSKIKGNYKLILFWSTWCPHCIETLPRITEIYEQYKDKGFEVIAISIDDEQDLWNRYIKDLDLNWINMQEPYSQGSKVLYMYDVNETPKMFLLSKDLTIISKPATRRQLEVRLKKILK
jgi:thiol-disulfide isomerase/thioredoxin